MSISQALLPEFDEEMKNTRKILECVPDGKFEYQPHVKSMQLGRLATHVAELPSWASTTLSTELLDLDSKSWKPNIATNRAQLLEMFDKAVKEAREKIASASDADWQVNWTMKFDGNTIMTMPRVAVVRSIVMNHLIHHRAQLGVFLRLNEIAIPGMYGPSADEMKFWEAQTA